MEKPLWVVLLVVAFSALSAGQCSANGSGVTVLNGKICALNGVQNIDNLELQPNSQLKLSGATINVTQTLTLAENSTIIATSSSTLTVGSADQPAVSVNVSGSMIGLDSIFIVCNTTYFANTSLVTVTSSATFNNPGEQDGILAGAGHGGAGGGNAAAGVAYDSYTHPGMPGCRGAQGASEGSAGGGVVSIMGQVLIVDGHILAEGAVATATGGAGSGGSIFINVTSFSGNGGKISCNGGDSLSSSGGGGGGRIAFIYMIQNFEGGVSAYGGGGPLCGGPGTVYAMDLGRNHSKMVVDNNRCNVLYTGVVTGMAGTYGFGWLTEDAEQLFFDELQISGAAKLAISHTGVVTLQTPKLEGDNSGALIFQANQQGSIQLPDNSLSVSITVPSLASIGMGPILRVLGGVTFNSNGPLQFSNLTIDPGARAAFGTTVSIQSSLTIGGLLISESISVGSVANVGVAVNVSGQIFVSTIEISADSVSVSGTISTFSVATEPGAGGASGTTIGGGGHGGSGGGPISASNGLAYDSYLSPSFPGGAGAGSQINDIAYGAAGGVISIIARTLTVTGSLVSDGQPGSDEAAAGAGGSIFINVTSLLDGSGTISANGGNSTFLNSGSGGGGRIATYTRTNNFRGTFSASGGHGPLPGGPGTVYSENSPHFKKLSVSGGLGMALVTPIESMNTATGSFAWITEPKISYFTFDEISLEDQVGLAFNPANVPSGTKININTQVLKGDTTGWLHVREQQTFSLNDGNLGSSLFLYRSSSAQLVDTVTVPVGVNLILGGEYCGVSTLLVYGKVYLNSTGISCSKTHEGEFQFTTVYVFKDGALNSMPGQESITTILCNFTGSYIDPLLDLSNATIIPDPDTATACIVPGINSTTTTSGATTSLGTTGGSTTSSNCAVGYWNGMTCIDVCGNNHGNCSYMVSCTDVGMGRSCGSCPTGTSDPTGTGETCNLLCGDDLCDHSVLENCISCPQDCGLTGECGTCGDNVCSSKENCTTCLSDCGRCHAVVCSNNCNGHGTCVDGICTCIGQWSGPSCNSGPGQPTNTTLNSTNPIVTVGVTSAKFVISIQELVEKDPSDAEIQSVLIPPVYFNKTSTQIGANTMSTYSAPLENGAFLSFVVWQFEEPSTPYSFAGVNTTYPSHTLKLSLTIQNWPFRNLANSLHIIFNTNSTNNNPINTCANIDPDSKSLQWLLVVINDTTLYGQFQDAAVIDERVRKITFVLNGYDNTSIAAVLPHFWDSAEMDPNFSVLLGDTTTTEQVCKKVVKHKSKVNKKAIEIAVPVVVGFFLIVAIVLILTPRIRTWWQVRHSTKVPSSDIPMDIEKIDKLQVNSHAGNFNLQL